MKENRGIFVKVNYKNIGELNSFIYDSMNGVNKNKDKYVMCAGKYSKDGWTMVFKAKSIREAEELLSINSAKRESLRKQELINTQLMDNDRVLIPSWINGKIPIMCSAANRIKQINAETELNYHVPTE